MRRKRISTKPNWLILIRQWLFSLIRNKFLLAGLLSLCLILGIWMINNGMILQKASQGKVDALLVLGGSITREIYVAELAKQYPQTPIIISSGSKDPCIWLIFQRANAPMQNVWLEKCADSTFTNFVFSLPILQQWQADKIKLITSPTHLPRAKWLGQIMLGSHGIWVEPDIVKERGIPANREYPLKTAWDLTHSLLWSFISQFYSPKCSKLTRLSDVNLNNRLLQGFTVKQCEHQGNLKL